MANLEFVDFTPMREVIEGQSVRWERDQLARPVKGLPQLFWGDGSGWWEANHFAIEKVTSASGNDLQTIKALMKHLQAYANWLEERKLDWRHFPDREGERPIFLWRGDLIDQRKTGAIKPSTASARMRAAIQFYRHADAHGLVSRNSPMWREQGVIIPYFDAKGFKRSLLRVKTNLSIPNRARHGARLEDGLTPLRQEHMVQLLRFLEDQGWEEQHLMWSIGFFTGARIGTITSLRVHHVENALEDLGTPGFYLLPVGPGTGVATKFDVSGNLLMPAPLRDALLEYAYAMQRLNRQDKAAPENRSLLFLTAQGNSYVESSFSRLMTAMRREAVAARLHFMANVKFHQSRCTYGTSVLEIALRVTDAATAIGFLKQVMLHKDEATSLKYVRFRENQSAQAKLADAYSKAFSGLVERNWDELHA